MSLIAATQITAVATAVLAAFAIVTAVFAFLAFRKQSAEVTILQQQARDQQDLTAKQTPVLELQVRELKASLEQCEREADERHRDQARLISAVLGPEDRPPDIDPGAPSVLQGRTAVDLINSSPEPVYRLVIGIVFIQGAGSRDIESLLEIYSPSSDPPRTVPITTATILPSGTHRVWIRGIGWSAILSGRSAVEVAFTDRAGSHWIRRATGELKPLDADPLDYLSSYGMYGPYDLQTPERIE